MIPAAARGAAEATLTSTCVITSTGTGPSFDPDTGLDLGTRATVYDGPCSIGPPTTSSLTTSGGDERLAEVRIMRLPAGTDVAVGHQVVVDGDTSTVYVIERVQTRTTEVLRRVRLVHLADAELVPR